MGAIAESRMTQRWRGQLWADTPVVVVEEDDETVVLHVPAGALVTTSTSRGIPEREGWNRQERLLASLETGVWNLEEKPQVAPLLVLAPKRAWWTVTIAWLPDGSPFGWKVDAVEPLRRTDTGFETMDLLLDVIAQPDLSGWTEKDRDEFDAAWQRGLITDQQKDKVLHGMADAVDRIERGAAPFRASWLDWRP